MPQETASPTWNGSEYSRTLTNAFHTHYSDCSDEWTLDTAMRSFPLLIQGEMKLTGRERVCDLGCGAGIDCEFYSRISKQVVGVDLYRHGNWDIVMRRRHNVTFHCCNVFDSIAEAPFALVVDNGCFHHQHPTRYLEYLRHVKSLMQEGACFALSTFKNESKTEFTDQYGRIHKYFGDLELRELFHDSKLRIFSELDCYRPRHGDYYRFSFVRHA